MTKQATRPQSQRNGEQETIAVFLMPSQRPSSHRAPSLAFPNKMVSNDADEEATRNPRNNHTEENNKAYDYSRAAPENNLHASRMVNPPSPFSAHGADREWHQVRLALGSCRSGLLS